MEQVHGFPFWIYSSLLVIIPTPKLLLSAIQSAIFLIVIVGIFYPKFQVHLGKLLQIRYSIYNSFCLTIRFSSKFHCTQKVIVTCVCAIHQQMLFQLLFSLFCVSVVAAVPTFNVTEETKDGTTFLLFTRSNPNSATVLVPDDDTTLGNYNPANDNKILIHGYGSSRNSSWMNNIKDLFLTKEDVNVILVDWAPLAAGPLYNVAVANTRLVGEYIGVLITYLISKGSSFGQAHILGHSLGGQTAGFAGASVNGQVARISGLDPAGPLYLDQGEDGRLDPSDAVFVEVLHTNAGYFIDGTDGVPFNCGHVDFWPNGGTRQAGCYDPFESLPDAEIGCSHGRAPLYYIESVNNPSAFTSYPCSDYANYSAGDCVSCGLDGCHNMGYGSEPGQTGAYYLATRIVEPFSAKHVFVDLRTSQSQQPATGHIFLTLNSATGSDKSEVLTEGGNHKIDPGYLFDSVIGVQPNLLNFDTAASVEFDQEGLEPPTTLNIDSIEVWDPETNQRLCTESSIIVPDAGIVPVTFHNC